jgi:hypothetical protein
MNRGKRFYNTHRSELWLFVSNIIFLFIFLAVFMGLIFYLYSLYKTQTFKPFELATVIVLLGGFLFYYANVQDCPPQLRGKLRRTGLIYLVSTVAYVLFGLYQAADQAGFGDKLHGASKGWFIGIYAFTFYVGAIALTFALFWTIMSIPALFRWRKDSNISLTKNIKNNKGEVDTVSIKGESALLGKHVVEHNGFKHEALIGKEPPFFLGDEVGLKVKITNLSDKPQDGRFYYLVFMPGGMRLERPLHIMTDSPLNFGPREEKTIQLGDPLFCAFLGIFQLVLVVGNAEKEMIETGKTSQQIEFQALFAGYSQDKESYKLQQKLVTLTNWIRCLTIIVVVLTAALICLSYFHRT